MKAYGLESGMKVEFLPIETVGKPAYKKYWIWLMCQRRVRVLEPYHVPRPNGGSYIIPEKFEYDGGSIPRWLLVLAIVIDQVFDLHGVLSNLLMGMVLVGLMIERFGLMLCAFAVHDFVVRYEFLVTGSGEIETAKNVREANSVMRRVNFATNDMILLGWIAHLAVVAGAWQAWNRCRKTKPAVSWLDLNYGIKV